MRATPVQPRGCTHFRIRRLLRAVARLYDAEFAEAGLKGTQYSLLAQLAAIGPVQPAELARRMGMDASTLTRNLKLLVDAGWVVQGPGPDGRSRSVSLTPAGRAKQLDARRHWKRAQLALNARLGEARVAALHALTDDALRLLDDETGADDPRGGGRD